MDLRIQHDVPLAPLTTLGVGGQARLFIRVQDAAQAEQAVAVARERELPLFVLGGGSNVVISDRGWDGLVLQIGIEGVRQFEHHGKIRFEVGAGVNWDKLVETAVLQLCGGLECLSGIPGSVGGTPVQNVGAYGQEVSASIVSVTVYDLAQRRTLTLSSAQCGFSYRTSIFNTDARGRYIILQVTYDLIPNAPPKLAYADLQRHFAGSGTQPTLKQVREAVRSIRSSKGMVISPGDPDSRSAGSFFKNPVLTAAQFREVVNRAAKHNLEVPNYPGLSEQHKISAAWLVENSGFFKGYVQGRAGISSKHALAIVNRGGASASDIIGLAEEIRARVESTWGILLQVEPVFVGDRAQS